MTTNGIDSTRGSRTRFRRVKAPSSDELTQLTHAIARRIAHYLERQGLLERDVEGAWLTSFAGGEENEDGIYTPARRFFQACPTYWKMGSPHESAITVKNHA